MTMFTALRHAAVSMIPVAWRDLLVSKEMQTESAMQRRR